MSLICIWKNTKADIDVSGIDNIHVNIASCCDPVPGDSIVGFITKNNGITIHRENCINVIHYENIINVNWHLETKNKYKTKNRHALN